MGRLRGIIFVLFVTAGIAICAAAQARTPVIGPQTVVPWTDHYRKATLSFGRILSQNGTATFDPIGTGVAVCTDDHHGFIVTAKHVFYDPSKDWFPADLAVRFSSQEKESLSQQLGTSIKLTNEKHEVYWTALDDGSDIAAIPVPVVMAGKLTDCIGLQDFATNDDVYDGATVFTFGYPTGGGVVGGPNALVRAITRSGVIAWTDPSGPLDYPLLLDSNVLPGNSGGPAFKVPTGIGKSGAFEVGGRVAFLGIVVAGLEAQVQVGDHPLTVQQPGAPTAMAAGVVGVGALGRVEPASKVRKLVSSLVQ